MWYRYYYIKTAASIDLNFLIRGNSISKIIDYVDNINPKAILIELKNQLQSIDNILRESLNQIKSNELLEYYKQIQQGICNLYRNAIQSVQQKKASIDPSKYNSVITTLNRMRPAISNLDETISYLASILSVSDKQNDPGFSIPTLNCFDIPPTVEEYFSTPDWNKYVGKLWQGVILDVNVPPNGVVVEIAPGGMDKVGQGLAATGFKGTIYIIEPDSPALEKNVKLYKELMPEARIIPIKKTLLDSIEYLPENVDAIIANHPLDDMIIGEVMDNNTFSALFGKEYSSPDFISKLWRKLEINTAFLEKFKQKVINDWEKLIKHCNPKSLAISQYESFFFTNQNIFTPDRNALDVLNRIRKKFPDSMKAKNTQDPNRWLIHTSL